MKLCAPGMLFLVAMQLPLVAAAQHIYTCRDKSGRELTSDQPIQECANLPMQERSKQGIVIKDIPPPPTAAEIAAQAVAEKRRKEDEEDARDQRRKDQLLMSTYSDEQSIEVARARALADFEDALKQARDHLTSLVGERDALRKETAPYQGKPLPGVLQRRSDALDTDINGESRTIDDRKRDIARINARFDADLDRYKQIEAQANSPASTLKH